MQKFGWKRKIGAQVSKSVSTAFESESKDDDAEVNNGEVDWLTLMPLKKRVVIGLEDSNAKSHRLVQEGTVLASSERYWEALKKWDEALQYTPCDGKIYEMKAQACIDLSGVLPAFKYKKLKHGPLYVYGVYLQACMELCEVFPAVQFARKAVEFCPTWWVAHQTLGRALLGLGEVRQALKSFSRAIHLNPAERELWEEDLQWAWSLLKKKQLLDEERKKEQRVGGAKVTPLVDDSGGSDSEEVKGREVEVFKQSENQRHLSDRAEDMKRLPNNFVQMRDPDPT